MAGHLFIGNAFPFIALVIVQHQQQCVSGQIQVKLQLYAVAVFSKQLFLRLIQRYVKEVAGNQIPHLHIGRVVPNSVNQFRNQRFQLHSGQLLVSGCQRFFDLCISLLHFSHRRNRNGSGGNACNLITALVVNNRADTFSRCALYLYDLRRRLCRRTGRKFRRRHRQHQCCRQA